MYVGLRRENDVQFALGEHYEPELTRMKIFCRLPEALLPLLTVQLRHGPTWCRSREKSDNLIKQRTLRVHPVQLMKPKRIPLHGMTRDVTR
jgi:hypothetical protein